MSSADLAKNDLNSLAATVDAAFERREEIGPATKGAVREAVEDALDLLDRGAMRVADKAADGSWRVNQWLKKAVLLSFRLNDMAVIGGGPGKASWWDKVPSKFDGWGDNQFRAAGFRAVPGCVVRRSAYIAPNVVLMPSRRRSTCSTAARRASPRNRPTTPGASTSGSRRRCCCRSVSTTWR